MFKLLIMRVALVELGVWDCYLGVSLVVCVYLCERLYSCDSVWPCQIAPHADNTLTRYRETVLVDCHNSLFLNR